MKIPLLAREIRHTGRSRCAPAGALGLRRAIAALIVLIAFAVALTPEASLGDVSPDVRVVNELIERGEHERGLRQARAVLADIQRDRESNPDEADASVDGVVASLWFEKARALTQLEQLDDAAAALENAVRLGYRNFTRMRTDSALVPLRQHEAFKAIDEAARHAEPERAREAYDAWIAEFGKDDYLYEIDQSRQLLYVTALDAVSHEEMRDMIEELADHLKATLFGGMPEYEVLVAVPTPSDANELLPQGSIGGLYEHRHRRLIARDIGPAMRHEFFHVMHFGHMERIGQIHPLWVQEGLATLYEDFEFDRAGNIRFLPNERHTIARQNLRSGQIIPWRDLFSYTSDRFMARSAASYPQVRSIFEFIADRGLLEAWYAAYVEAFHDDPTGVLAFERTFHQPMERIESEWKRWLRQRPAVPMHLQPGDASLGVETRPNVSNDGVLITRILRGSAAERDGLAVGDVILSVNGQATRTIEELRRVIGGRRVGDRVQVRIRRDGRHTSITVELRPLRP